MRGISCLPLWTALSRTRWFPDGSTCGSAHPSSKASTRSSTTRDTQQLGAGPAALAKPQHRHAAAVGGNFQGERTIRSAAIEKVPFTKEMKATHTILCPQMSPIHFEMLEAAFRGSGYRFEILPNDNKQAVDVGLKYVNNDACYPSLIVVGQIMEALLSGKYDLDKVAVIITQTGGGCRASNYIGFIRRALKKAGFGHVPVISLNLSGLEGNPGFKLTPSLIMRIVYGALFGDIFMKCVYHMRP